MGNRFFAQFPAEQDRLPLDFAGEIEQPDIEIFNLNAGRIDLRQRIFHPLFGLGALGFAPSQRNDVERHPAAQKNAVLQRLLLGLGFVNDLLGLNCRAQLRFEYRQQRLGFVQSEGSDRGFPGEIQQQQRDLRLCRGSP